MSSKSPELRFVEFIPHEERHGHPFSQFTLWFSVNMMILTTVTGSLGIANGLNMFWSVIGIVLGNLIGAFFVAAHAVQGPRLGIPQMIQSRAQFGVYGAVIPIIAVFVMYLGYFASNTVIAGDAVASATSISKPWGIILVGLVILVVTYWGHELIHSLERWLAIVLAVGFLGISVVVISHGLPGDVWAPDDFNGGAFLLLIAVTATWQLTFAPYVADYTRYLPANTNATAIFAWTYAGLAISTVWLMILGAALGLMFSDYGVSPASVLADMLPDGWAPLVYLFVVIGVIATNVMNLYGAFMSLTTMIDTVTRLRSSLILRAVIMGIVFVIATGLAVAASGDFMVFFSNLLLVLSYLLFPWTSINLVDFYFVRKGRYVVKDIFRPQGRYGRFAWRALAAYLLSIAIELPFMSTAFFTGPLFTALGGVDIAWIIALVLPGVIYFLLMQDVRRKAESLETDTLDVVGINEAARIEFEHLD